MIILTLITWVLVHASSFASDPGQAKGNSKRSDANKYLLARLGPVDNVYALAFSPDGRFLLSGGDEFQETYQFVVNRWDIVHKSLSTKIKSGNKRQIEHITYSPRGRFFAVGDDAGEVYVWSHEGRKINSFRHLHNQTTDIKHLRFADENSVVSIDWHGIAQKWNIKNNRTDTSLLDGDIRVLSAATSTASLRRVVWCDKYALQVRAGPDKSGSVRVRFKRYKTFELIEMENVSSASIKFNQETSIDECAISEDGSLVLAAAEKGILYLFDIIRKKLRKKWQGHPPTLNIYSVLAISKHKAFVTADAGGNVRFWSYTGKLLAEIQYYKSATTALAVSPDAAVLATSGERQRILLWDLDAILRSKPK
jgi:WD40 repeat protein